MQRLLGKTALITGASTGIGQAIAIRFAQEGANVAINFRSGPEQAAATQAMVRQARCAAANGHGEGQREITVQGDISKEEDVRKLFATVVEELGPIDIVVNNAGIQKPAASDEIDMADFDRVLGVNLRGAFL